MTSWSRRRRCSTDKMSEVSDARTGNLDATRDYIRILQEHESALVAQG